jgi:hypothetical protein
MTTYQHGIKERSTLCLPPFALLGAIRKGRDFRRYNRDINFFVIGMLPEGQAKPIRQLNNSFGAPNFWCGIKCTSYDSDHGFESELNVEHYLLA